jgi:hypothetical protein
MARFRLDRKGVAELEAVADLRPYAKSVAREAKLIAPVGKPAKDPHPGRYRNSIRAEGNDVVAGSRNAFYAWMLEFGTIDTPVFATLRRATRIAGLRMEENRHAQARAIKRQAIRFSDLSPAEKRRAAENLKRRN